MPGNPTQGGEGRKRKKIKNPELFENEQRELSRQDSVQILGAEFFRQIPGQLAQNLIN